MCMCEDIGVSVNISASSVSSVSIILLGFKE